MILYNETFNLLIGESVSFSIRPDDFEYEASILIVDDEQIARSTNRILCRDLFEEIGVEYKLREASTLDEALLLTSRETFHVILLDKDLGQTSDGRKIDGVRAIPEFKAIQPNVEILILTGDDNISSSVDAIKLGATDYLLKIGDPKYIEYRNEKIKTCVATARLKASRQRASASSRNDSVEYVCKSPAMRRLNNELQTLAETKSPTPILFLGDSGLGKTEAAKQLSKYRAKFLNQTKRPFFNINITTLSKELAANELFGHEPNSFTGAKTQASKPGYFELANNGDLFLDEIGDADLSLQAQLLKVLEEGEFQRVGGNRSIPTSARVIFATNKNLEELVEQGLFRKDLFFRISALSIQIPSLEERREDIPDLVNVLLGKISQGFSVNLEYTDLPTDLVDYFCRADIPGNIRGIENDLVRLALQCVSLRSKERVLVNWKSYLKPKRKLASETPRFVGAKLTLEDFLKIETDFLSSGPIRLSEVKAAFESKLIEEAAKKFDSYSAQSAALGIDPSNYHRMVRTKKNLRSTEKGKV